MAIRVLNRFPGANVRVLSVHPPPAAELVFAAEPHGGTGALWFNFRIEDPDPPTPLPPALTLTLRFFGNSPDGGDPDLCRPVMREPGKSWNRLRAPVVTTLDDCQPLLQWTVPYPSGPVEIAFCHPYGREELDVLLQRTKGYWRETGIGLTPSGHTLMRIDNPIGGGTRGSGTPRGLYLLARQCADAAPGSWVLDGMLSTFSRARPANWRIWCVPFADPDGVFAGDSGSCASAYSLGGAWGTPPRRHETLVLQQDMVRWAARCRPELVVDLQAAGAGEQGGIHAGPAPGSPEAMRGFQAWANIMQQALGPEFAADPFMRTPDDTPPGDAVCVSEYARETIGCCALAIATPSAVCRDTLMTPKQYREAGRRLAQAILSRW